MLQNDFVIKNLTSFKIGGEIKRVYFPTNIDEFVDILKTNPDIKVVGQLSNTLISSYGYNGEIVVTSKMDNLDIKEIDFSHIRPSNLWQYLFYCFINDQNK